MDEWETTPWISESTDRALIMGQLINQDGSDTSLLLDICKLSILVCHNASSNSDYR